MKGFSVHTSRIEFRAKKVAAASSSVFRRVIAGGCGLACAMMLAAPAQAVITDGLRAYWDFEGDLADKAASIGSTDSLVADTGMFLGTAGSADFGTGFFGQGLVMDGEDGYVEVPSSTDLEISGAGSEISISAWFRVDTFDTNWQALIAKGEGDRWRVHRNGGNQNMAFTGGTGGDITMGPDVSDGQWHHIVALTRSDEVSQIWLDGAMVGEAAGRVIGDSGAPVLIGNNPEALGREWEGAIDDVGIWGRALDPTEIGMLYSGGTGNPIGGETIIQGDFNGDGVINRDDFNVLRDNMSAQFAGPVNHALGDFNFDGRVNLQDFFEFKEVFPGAVAQAAAIPEPSTVALALCAMTALLGVCRKTRRSAA